MRIKEGKSVLTTNIYRSISSLLNSYIECHKNMEKPYRDVGGRLLMEYLTESILLSRKVYDEKDKEKKIGYALQLKDKMRDCEVLLATLSDVRVLSLKAAGHLSGEMGETMTQIDSWINSLLNKKQ